MVTPLQRRVLQIVSDSIEPLGFVIGGGMALQALGITSRYSDDVDSYVNRYDARVFVDAEQRVLDAAQQAGLGVTVIKSLDWFRAFVFSDPVTGEQTRLDLAPDNFVHPPVTVEGYGSVIAEVEVIAFKARALVDRQAERDYVDLDRILRLDAWNVETIWSLLSPMRPEISMQQFAQILRDAAAGDPEEYEKAGVPTEELEPLFARFDNCAELLGREDHAVLQPPELFPLPEEPALESRSESGLGGLGFLG